jgi:hypothetical protein
VRLAEARQPLVAPTASTKRFLRLEALSAVAAPAVGVPGSQLEHIVAMAADRERDPVPHWPRAKRLVPEELDHPAHEVLE